MESSGSVVLLMVPALQLFGSSFFTLATHRVNCAMRVFSCSDSIDDFIASFGVRGTL
jgi:hypothetical protein